MSLENELKKALKSNNPSVIRSVFEEIYRAYGKLVYYVISKFVTDKEDIKDLTQEVFVDFYNNLEKKQIKNVKFYLTACAKNRALTFIKNKNVALSFDDSIIVVNDFGFSEYFDLFDKFKEYITEYEIQIIYAHCVYGLKFREIAKLQRKPLNTVLATYNRAVKKLKGGKFNE